MDNLFVNYDILTKNYTEIAITFETLENLTKKYNFDNNESNELRIYEGLKEMTVKLANRMDGELNAFKSKIKNLIRYEKENMTTLKEVFDMRSKVHSEYQRQGSPAFTSNSMRIQGTSSTMKGSNVEIESPVPL
jgi:hypothetical protein